MTLLASSAEDVFASAHISLTYAVSGSMSSTVTAPAFSMSLPVLYTLRFVLPLRHWLVSTTTVPFSVALLIRGIMDSDTWPRPEPEITTPLDPMNTGSNSPGSMPG